jgi:sec-independent protein translocase protein TatB
MFDIGWSELLIIGIVALIVIGPKELPAVLRTVGQWMGKIRRMASDFQGQFQEAMREAEVDDLKKQVDDMASSVSDYANFDPVEDIQKEVDDLVGDPLGDNETKNEQASPDTASAEAASAQEMPDPVAADAPAPQTSEQAQGDAAAATEDGKAKKTSSSGSGG